MEHFSDKWLKRYQDLAYEVSMWSKDPSTKCGAVIVRPDKTVCSLGYNGFPRGMKDDTEIYQDREQKYERVIHCEINAIMSARERLDDYTLFVYPFNCCPRCAVHVIQAGIKHVVAPTIPDDKKERWAEALARTEKLFEEAGVKVTYFR